MNSYEYLQEEAREDGVNVIDYPSTATESAVCNVMVR